VIAGSVTRRLEGPVAYLALAAELRDALGRGEFSQGRQLPTEQELSETYDIGRQTVRRALQDLVSEGSVYRVRGRGTFATPSVSGGQYVRSFGTIDELLAVSEDTRLEMLHSFERLIDPDAAGRLQLPSDEVLFGVSRRLHGDAPIFATRVYLPARFATHLREGGVPEGWPDVARHDRRAAGRRPARTDCRRPSERHRLRDAARARVRDRSGARHPGTAYRSSVLRQHRSTGRARDQLLQPGAVLLSAGAATVAARQRSLTDPSTGALTRFRRWRDAARARA
jgi:DNA-binding transcriptional regulator YhcF (GntR family)